MSNFAINLQNQNIKILEEEMKSLEIARKVKERQFDYFKEFYDENLSPEEITGLTLHFNRRRYQNWRGYWRGRLTNRRNTIKTFCEHDGCWSSLCCYIHPHG